MFRRSVSFVAAGLFDLVALLADVRAPLGFALVAAFVATLLGDELSDSWAAFVAAGLLAATGLDLMALLADVRAPLGFVLVATLVAVLGLLWLADELSDSWAAL